METCNKRLTRSSQDKWVAGDCGGIARYFGWNADVLRLVYVILTVCTIFSGILVYCILWLVIPTDSSMDFTNPSAISLFSSLKVMLLLQLTKSAK